MTTQYEEILNQIRWPKYPTLNDSVLWNQNCEVVKLLCRLGSVTKWVDNGTSYLPYYYNIESIEVIFLPHWGFYSVAEMKLTPPRSEDDVVAAINAIKTLQRLGLED